MPSSPLRPFARLVLTAMLVASSLFAPALNAADAPATHAEEVAAWHRGRLERLQSEDGWLSLVGLFWLKEGDNTVGSGAGNDLVFPESSPERIGILRLQGGKVEVIPAAGVTLTVGGEALPAGQPRQLTTDANGKAEPTTVALGSVRFFPIARQDRIGIRVKDSQAPTRLEFHGIETFPVSPDFRVEARFVPYDPPRSLTVPNILGTPTQETCPGALEFTHAGKTHRLDVLAEGEELFVIFGDTTNAKATYGGGRFLYTAAPDAAGKVVLDFNKAYNPPCVFTPYATCPLPPPQNRLAMAVEAGEKMYGPAHE